MDRRKENLGGNQFGRWTQRRAKDGVWESVEIPTWKAHERRSGQDRRKHDMLGEAKDECGKIESWNNNWHEATAIHILITMMERRGKA